MANTNGTIEEITKKTGIKEEALYSRISKHCGVSEEAK